MANLNKIMLIGNIGRTDTRTFDNGKMVNASLAVSENYTNRNGDKVENTTWFNLVFNGKLADIADKYLTKGSPVYVEGRMRERRYQKDGEERSTWEVMVQGLQLLGRKAQDEDDLPEDF